MAALLLLTGFALAQDPRVAVFEAYNAARTYEDVKPLVSAVLAQQYAAVASRDPRRVEEILLKQQLASYRSRIVDVDGARSFLVLEHVQPKVGHDSTSQAYLLTKSAAGAWTLANRMLPDSIMKSLWLRDFRPAEFARPASCSFDGREFPTRSVLAIRREESIEVSLYPFEFTQADLQYWRQISGLPGTDSAADSHFGQRIPTVCRLIVNVGDGGRPSLVNVGFNDRTGALSRSSLWQPSKTDVSRLVYENEVIELTTSGSFGQDRSGFRWNVNIKVPVWRQGL
ncbi:MAG TPA: hypothetical protein VEU08_04980 [Vicinamibacterales bacterium]|nr:hypothetical protein [Vicinamibacterales bacterium]